MRRKKKTARRGKMTKEKEKGPNAQSSGFRTTPPPPPPPPLRLLPCTSPSLGALLVPWVLVVDASAAFACSFAAHSSTHHATFASKTVPRPRPLETTGPPSVISRVTLILSWCQICPKVLLEAPHTVVLLLFK